MTTAAFNLTTVAVRLDVTRRFLVDWLRRHPWDKFGQPYYSAIAGKKKLFIEADIARIFAALPKPPSRRPQEAQPCPSSSVRPIATTQRIGSAARTSGSVLTEALALARKKSQRKSLPSGRQTSNVVPMRGRKTRLSPPPL